MFQNLRAYYLLDDFLTVNFLYFLFNNFLLCNLILKHYLIFLNNPLNHPHAFLIDVPIALTTSTTPFPISNKAAAILPKRAFAPAHNAYPKVMANALNAANAPSLLYAAAASLIAEYNPYKTSATHMIAPEIILTAAPATLVRNLSSPNALQTSPTPFVTAPKTL